MAERIALVTGAGSGIGRAAARGLAGAGYRVAVVGRRVGELEETSGGKMLVLPADVTNPEAVRGVFARLEKECGRLDVLFNNAGTGSAPVPMDELTDDQWLGVVAVNLNGSFFCAREAMRLMKKQRPPGGRIINNGSLSAHVPRPNSAPYTATKHAITGLTRSISLDGRKFDIVCSQIDIGNADTPMTARMSAGVPQADGSLQPEPVMNVQHVADAILYIANLPLDANVQFMTVMAAKMPFIGRG
jgi:NAD(P)-dependent dehydrogenase (short-subunit alcohol dehydrogenase family)